MFLSSSKPSQPAIFTGEKIERGLPVDGVHAVMASGPAFLGEGLLTIRWVVACAHRLATISSRLW
jgi:hypothetical protein